MALGSLGKRGTRETRYGQFGGGVVWDVDATELRPNQASDLLNVDLDGETIRKRRGKVAYNSSLGAFGVLGALAYYPKSGTRKAVLGWGTTVSADNGSGTFSSILTGLTSGATHVDLLQYQDTVYIGNGLDALYRWPGSGTAAAVSLLAVPAAAPTVALRQSVVEAFDSGSWTVGGSALSQSYDTDIKLQGTGCLKVTATAGGARGSTLYKAFSGGIHDLSQAEDLIVWYYATRVGITFQLGIAVNAGSSVDFSKFPAFVTAQKETWVPVRVPLGAIAPADRTQCPGMGIRFVDKPSGAGWPVSLYFDQAMPAGPFADGRYQYRSTYAELSVSSGASVPARETNPSPIAVIDIAALPPTEGIEITPELTGPSGTNAARIYRKQKDAGPFRTYRLIGTAPLAATTLAVAMSTTTSETVTPTSLIGLSPGNILLVGSEKLLVRDVDLAAGTLTCDRGFDGTTAATHLILAALSFVKHLDQRSDGQLTLDAADELVQGRQAPPVANSYALVNHRLIAADVTVGGTRYPWRCLVSRQGFPEEFSTLPEPEDPTWGGWFDLPEKDAIRRVLEFDGAAVLFCERSIWTLEGDGFDNYVVRKRADVGLDAREAVCIAGRLIYFLAADGLRVLAPNASQVGLFSTWLISEPVASKLHAIPKAYRTNAALGVDDQGRVLLSYTPAAGSANSKALVFDPRLPDALDRGTDPKRPGWTYYDSFGFSRFLTLKRGGGDNGELLGGDVAAARLLRLFTASDGTDLETDESAAIAWSWQSRAESASLGQEVALDQAEALLDAQSGVSVTLTATLDRGNATAVLTKTLGTDTALSRVGGFFGAAARGRTVQLQISGSHSARMTVRSLSWGGYLRGS